MLSQEPAIHATTQIVRDGPDGAVEFRPLGLLGIRHRHAASILDTLLQPDLPFARFHWLTGVFWWPV